jgi:NAD(P)-dependent dehydrogenase (short-subunit alcohol dehydrogenase family)
MSDKGQKVAIIIGGSQGIGASLVTAYRRQGWSVVATARTMTPTEDPDVLTVDGDLADPATADRIVSGALGRFGRIDTLINNADVYISNRSPTTPPRTMPWWSASTSPDSSG